MTEDEYCDASDLGRIEGVMRLMDNCILIGDPNETRKKSIMQNLSLILQDLNKKVNVE